MVHQIFRSCHKLLMDWKVGGELKMLWCLMANQSNCCRTGVKWLVERVPVMMRAAEFLTSWNLWMNLSGKPKRRYVVAVIMTGNNQGANPYGCAVRWERQRQVRYVTKKQKAEWVSLLLRDCDDGVLSKMTPNVCVCVGGGCLHHVVLDLFKWFFCCCCKSIKAFKCT